MILASGEILFDHFPKYRRVGGAPLNFSWHLKKLGCPVRLVTRVGDDAEGRELRDLLAQGGFEAADLQVDPEHPTGAVKVQVDGNGVPTFDILPGAAFDYLEMDGSVKALMGQGPALVYYGTLAQRTEAGRRFIQQVFARAGEGTRFLCDLNLRPRCYTPEVVRASLERADVVKLNEEELDAVTRLEGKAPFPADPCRALMERYEVEMVAMTKGDRGSEIHNSDGRYTVGPVGNLTVADTVGAGDAYAAVLALGYLRRWHPETILEWASRFSAAVCRIQGALPDSEGFYDPFNKMMKDDQNE